MIRDGVKQDAHDGVIVLLVVALASGSLLSILAEVSDDIELMFR